MTRCDWCHAGDTFVFGCDGCGGQYCGEHRAPDHHLCIDFPPLGSDGAPGRSARPIPFTGAPVRRATGGTLALLWLLAVLLVEHHGVRLGPAGTVGLVVFGAVALWLAAASIPRVGAWMHADG